MASELAELYVLLRAVTSPFTKGMGEAAASGESFGSKIKSGPVAALANFGKIVTEGAVGVGIASVKMAGDFQANMLKLKTSAGNTGDFVRGRFTGDLKTASDGILKMAVDTATSTKELSSGMYMIQSAGYNAADGLKILRAAAEGAKAEGAPLKEMGDALTTVMKDYRFSAGQAVNATNGLIAIVAHGKTTMAEMASSIHNVAPYAKAAGVSFAEMGGALSTLTSHGISADQATQNLRHLIVSLGSPSQKAGQYMEQLGLKVSDVTGKLGQRGLTGTLEMLVNAIGRHTKGGMVMIDTFYKSKSAAESLKQMLGGMPPELRKLADAYMNNQISASGYSKAIKGLGAGQNAMGTQFATLVRKAEGFSNAVKAGTGTAQPFSAALKNVLGDSTSLGVALNLTGKNMGDFKANVKAVGDASKQGGAHVENWGKIQQTFNFQMTKLKEVVEVTAIKIGNVLIPIIMSAVSWFQQHQGVAKALAAVIAGVLAASVVAFAAKSVISFAKTAKEVVTLGGNVGKLAEKFKKLDVGPKLLGGISKVKGALSNLSLGSKLASGAKTAGSALASAAGKAAELARAAKSGISTAGQLAAEWGKVGLKAAWTAVKLVAVKTAQVAIKVATAAWAAIQWILDAAMDANPIGLVVLAIAALVAGVIYAYTHFKWFRDILNAVFSWLKGAVVFVINFVKDHWKLILAILTGPIGLAVLLITKFWKQISGAVSAAITWVIDFVKQHWQLIIAILTGPIGIVVGLIVKYWDDICKFFSQGVSTAIKFFTDLPSNILRIASNFGSMLINAGIDLINGLINGIGSMANALWNAVVGLAKSALHGILSTFGIASPSKVMHEAGTNLVQGLINGVAAKMPPGGIAAIMSQGMGNLGSIGMHGSLAVTGGAGALAGGGYGGGTTVVNNTFYSLDKNTIIDGQKLYDEIQKHSLIHNRRNTTNGLSLH